MSAEFSAAQLIGVSHFPAAWQLPLLKATSGWVVPLDQLVLITCFLLTIPLGFVHTTISNPTWRHVYSIFFGAAIGYVLIGMQLLACVLSCVITYGLVIVFPRNRCALAVLVFSVVYMSSCHLYRMFYIDETFWSWELTMIQCVMTVKQITFAYNLHDGRLLAALKPGEQLHANPAIHEFRAARAISEVPSMLQYASFMLFFGGIMVGPAFEIKEFLEFSDLSMFRKHKLTSIPAPRSAVLRCLGNALCSFVALAIGSTVFPIKHFVETAAFVDHTSMSYKLVYFFIGVSLVRFRYYFAWYMSEAGCIATGFGFNGYDQAGNMRFDRLNNIDMAVCELGDSIPAILNGWNKKISSWLKDYIYLRVLEVAPTSVLGLAPKSFANIVAKFTSAFWHGFYPGFYLFFLSAWLCQLVDAEYHRVFRPLVYDENKQPRRSRLFVALYHFGGWFEVHWTMNYFGISFCLLEGMATLNAWKSVYFIGHFLVAAFLIVMRLIKPVSRRSKQPDGVAPTAGARTIPTKSE